MAHMTITELDVYLLTETFLKITRVYHYVYFH